MRNIIGGEFAQMARLGYTIGFLSTWMGLITVLLIYFFLGSKYAITNDEKQPVQKRVDDGSHINAERLDLSTSEYPSKDNLNIYYKLLLKELNIPHRKGSRTDFNHVILLSNLLPHIHNISRMTTPSKRTFLDYISPVGLPVIFTDMLVGTTLENWSWDYVKKRWGNHVFHNTRQGNYSNKVNKYGKHYVHRVSVRLADFIDVVTGVREPKKQEKGLYITKQKIIPPEVMDEEFYYPPFYPGKHKNCFLEPTGWIGAAGTFTQGHIDSKDNFVYQLIGRKRWTIYPPTDYKYLYYIKDKGSLEWSQVLNSPGKPDLITFPLYKKTHPMQFVMGPGEVLYLPRGWTHFVENLTPSLMLNVWRRGPAGITELWIKQNREEIKRLCL